MKDFTKNVFKLLTGSVLAQIINIGLLPVITRLYTPKDYGLFVVFLSVLMIIFPFSTLRFNYALMLPKNDDEAFHLLLLSLVSVTCISIIVFLGMGIVDFFEIPKKYSIIYEKKYMFFLPLGVFILGTIQSFKFWAVRFKQFSIVSWGTIIQSISERTLMLIYGIVYQSNAIGLISGKIIGSFFTLIYLLARIDRVYLKERWKKFKRSECVRLSKKFREYHLLATFSILLRKIAEHLPSILILFYFGPVIAGCYGLALKAINMPAVLIGDSVSQVFFQFATDNSIGNKQIAEKALTLFKNLILLSLPLTLVLTVFGKELFSIIFGNQWIFSGELLKVLSFSLFSLFLYRPFSVLFDAYQKQKQKIVFDSTLIIGRSLIIIIFAHITNSALLTLFIVSLVTFTINIVAFIYMFNLISVKFVDVYNSLLNTLIILAPTIIIVFAIKFGIEKNNGIIIGIIVSCVMVQCFIILYYTHKVKAISFIKIRPFRVLLKNIKLRKIM